MAFDAITYAKSKTYTDETVIGGGAIKGKNCTIDSITPITGGNEVTFKWTLDDGTVQTDTMDVMDGQDGQGIDHIYINAEDHLIVVYDDGTEDDCGEIVVYSSVDSVNGKTGVVTLDLEDVVNVGSNLTYDSSTNTLSADAQEITVDSALSDSSENPVQNKVVKGAIDAKQDSLTFDDVPTQNSNNPVKSGGVYTAISGKQDALTFDNTPTENSTNPVKSGGVYSALAGKANTSDIPDITGKADKVASAVSGNFAGLDGNGNLTDSGSKASDFLTQHQDITGKADKVTGATSGHFAGLDSNGNLTDSGKSSSDFAGQVSSMPTASSSLVGKVYQFIGTTDSTYTHGYFYECVGDSDTYSWENVPVGAGDTQIQSDWNQTDNTQKDYIKNKPTIPSAQVNSDWTASSGVAEILHKPTLGTASAKDVPVSGNASTTQVVMGDDTRLTDSRNAADVYSWAKAENKPSYTASEVGAIASTDKGANNGVAELDSTGKVPSSQLPSYVDDVLEYNSQSAFPSTGETGKIYIAKDTNKTYRWSGTAYVEISESLALGETSSTAYAGNKGKANADAISAIKDGSTIDSFGDVESALSDKISKSSTAGLVKNDGTIDTTSYVSDISGKADKAVPSANGNVATLNSSGNLVDSGKTLGASVPADAVFTDTTYNVVSKTANGLVPQLPNDTSTTKYLRQDGTWATPTNTKNTAGSTDSSSKLFLIGAPSQEASSQTYSQDTAYVGTDGNLYSGTRVVATQNMISDAWASGQSYVAGQYRIDGNVLYKCKQDHTSSSSNRPPYASYWDEVSVASELQASGNKLILPHLFYRGYSNTAMGSMTGISGHSGKSLSVVDDYLTGGNAGGAWYGTYYSTPIDLSNCNKVYVEFENVAAMTSSTNAVYQLMLFNTTPAWNEQYAGGAFMDREGDTYAINYSQGTHIYCLDISNKTASQKSNNYVGIGFFGNTTNSHIKQIWVA